MTKIVEQEPPWTFTCPVCHRTTKSEFVVICQGLQEQHAPAEMLRNFIKVQSAMSGDTRYIEVYS